MTGTFNDDRRFSDDDIAAAARSVEPHDFDRIAPPPLVWDNIVAELEVEIAASEADARRRTARWAGSTRILSIAAAIVAIVGVTVAAFALTGDDPESGPLAVATMTDADLQVATDETAAVAYRCDGDRCTVDIDLTGVPDAGAGDLELWVINADVSDMHSLGVVTASGSFVVPDGVTPADFPIVDISVEPRDGVATHSGQSVLRGIFDDT